MHEVEGCVGAVLVLAVLAGIVAAAILVAAWSRVVLLDRWRRETPQTAILDCSCDPGRVDGEGLSTEVEQITAQYRIDHPE